jgi:hypothetical protein
LAGPEKTELDQLLADVGAFLKRTLPGLGHLLTETTDLWRQVADRQGRIRDSDSIAFNIFHITERADYEVTTHQRVLADLLDPRGTHGQGNVFLGPFLELIRQRTGMRLPPPNGLWEVDNGKDNIDVRLRHTESKYRVIIETKWKASDRPGQVVDYWREEKNRTANSRIPVVFLTRTRRLPDLGQDESDHAQLRADLVCLTFKDDIAPLLQNALDQEPAVSPRVRETVRQYIQLLEELQTDVEDEE